jgi:hypothetical protein
MFTIDSENNIAVCAEVPAAADNVQAFDSEKEFAKLVAGWPAARLVEVWNSFAGVAPFDHLKPVHKFTSRKLAVARIWAAVQRLAVGVAQSVPDAAPSPARSKKVAAKASRPATARQATNAERTNKKAEVTALMKRAKGATMAEIIKLTGWQKHTVRGFMSLLGSKGGEKIESVKDASGQRVYRMAK